MHFRRAIAYVGANEWKKATAAYAEAVRLDPENSQAQNGFAWLLATCPAAEFRDATGARQHAEKAADLAPLDSMIWNTVGVARYRAWDWQGAITAFKRAEELSPNKHYAFNAFFLAMAHWQLGSKDEARTVYETGVEWMQRKMPQDEELRRFRAEAAQLVGVKEK
jgi:Tfp pilus assembly protein PilF